MAFAGSATVTQSGDGTVLTFTDTSTGITGFVSRNLVITDENGNVLDTVNMGATLVATFDITADGYFTFTETIVDGSGTHTVIVNYLSTAFYEITYANAVAQLGCDCICPVYLQKAELFKSAALRFALGGFGVAAAQQINKANIIVSGT